MAGRGGGGGGGWLRLKGAGVDVVSGCEKKYKVYDGSLFCIESNNLVPTHSGGGSEAGQVGGWGVEGLRDFLKQFFVLSVKTIFTPLPLYGFYDYVGGGGGV